MKNGPSLTQEEEDTEMNQVTATLTDIFTQFRTDSVITLLESPQHPTDTQKRTDTIVQEEHAEEQQMISSSPMRKTDVESEFLSDEESLDLVFDVRMNCFYDPKTGKTYPLDDSDEESAALPAY